MMIDHERPDDYAAAIENNRAAALAWLNTALKNMSHEAGLAQHPHARGVGYPLRGGSGLHITVKFVRPQEQDNE